jgi:hypothetical protein
LSCNRITAKIVLRSPDEVAAEKDKLQQEQFYNHLIIQQILFYQIFGWQILQVKFSRILPLAANSLPKKLFTKLTNFSL